MSYYALSEDLWQLSEDLDRRFRRTLFVFLLPLLLIGILVPLLQIEGLQRGGGDLGTDRYAELLQDVPEAPLAPEEEEPKPAEEEKIEQKPEEPKPQPTPEPQPEAKPEPTQEQVVQQARQVASRTGVMAFADQLADLRDESLKGFDESRALSSVVTARSGSVAGSGAPAAPNFSQSAQATSGGISGAGTGETRRAQIGTGLSDRRTTKVERPKGFGEEKKFEGQGGDKLLAGRTLEEIQLTFDRNKGAFYAIFNRAMRDNPNLGAGKIVVSITIAPDGSVTECKLVSSTFNDPELEKKVVQRVQLLNFGAKAVPPFTYPNYPINFLPS